MTEPHWIRHSISCLPDCEGDWECHGCQCHDTPPHAWGCHERCRDTACECCCHQPDLFEEGEEP